MSLSVAHKNPRSCLACREARDKDQLIRFVLSPQSEVVPDLEARLPGRGAYTCMSVDCLRTAILRNQFNRAFKRQVTTPDPDGMTALVVSMMRERILGYLGLANRAGKIISGGSLVTEAIRGKTKPGLVIVAVDTSGSIAEKIVSLACVHGIQTERALMKDDLGSILGKAPRSAVAVRQSGFIPRLVNEINRYRNFLGEVQGI